MSPNSSINQKSSTLKCDTKETTPKENDLQTPPHSYELFTPGAPIQSRIRRPESTNINISPLAGRSLSNQQLTMPAYLTITPAPAASLPFITGPSSSTRYWNLIGIANQQRNDDHASENSSTPSSDATNAHEISSSSSSSKINDTISGMSGKKESWLGDRFCKLSKKLEEEEKDFW